MLEYDGGARPEIKTAFTRRLPRRRSRARTREELRKVVEKQCAKLAAESASLAEADFEQFTRSLFGEDWAAPDAHHYSERNKRPRIESQLEA
jgi:hypothetical protein